MFDWIDVFFGCIALAWVLFTLPRFAAVRRLPRLPRLSLLETGETRRAALEGVRVSVIVTARNESLRIENTVRRLIAQRDVALQVVVVDDRSTDTTPQILDGLAAEHAELRHVRIDTLPSGWLGKTHACKVGADSADGDWLLFADADAGMAPDLIARAVHAARAADVEHVALFPREYAPGFLARAANAFLAALVAPLAVRINTDARGAFAGVGAFNLVRADAYRKVGGHDALRLAVVDDLRLGLALYRAGYRTRLYEAFQDLAVEWAPTLRAMVRVVEKNMFAVLGFSIPLAALTVLALTIGWGGAVIGPFTGRLSGVAAGLALLSAGLPARNILRRAGHGTAAAWFGPLTLPVLVVAIVQSTVKTLARGGVRWRDTFYPLRELSPGGVWFVGPAGIRDALLNPKPPRYCADEAPRYDAADGKR